MDWEHPKAGGAEVNLRKTLSRLSDRGHEVHLFTSRYPGSPKKEELEGVKIRRYGFESRTNELLTLTLGQIYLSYLIRELDPDLLYTINSIAGWFPLTGKPHVQGVHHLYGRSIFGQFSFPVNLIAYLVESLSVFLSRGRKVVSVSPSTTDILLEKGFEREDIVEIVNGVDTDKYCAGDEADDPTILYLGRLEYNKGVDLLPEIEDSLDERLDDFILEVAGFGRRGGEVERFAEDTSDVVFHGYVDEQKKKELLQEAWLVITPSRVEGWGMTVSEANACGTPVVGFDTEGLRDSIEDEETGLLVDYKRRVEEAVEEFSRQVTEVLEDDERRHRMSVNALELAENRDWEDAVDELERFFEDLVRDRR